MRALITGISGFVGHHLTAELLGAGYEVHGVVISDVEPIPPGVSDWYVADVTGGPELGAALDASAPEVVFHLAGASSVGQSFRDPIGTWKINLDGTLNLLEGLRQRDSKARCVAVTSAEAYGVVALDELPVTAETPLSPQSPYGASKAAADLAAFQYRLAYGMPVIRARAFNHIGPGQDARFFVPNVARQIAAGERAGLDRIEISLGNLITRRDFTDVRDIVRAYRLMAEHGDPDAVYLPCSGRSRPLTDLVDILTGMATEPVVVHTDATLQREGEQPDLYGSPDRLSADTGWVPQIPLEDSLKDTLDWWRARVAEED